jgi:hypothetical protein
MALGFFSSVFAGRCFLQSTLNHRIEQEFENCAGPNAADHSRGDRFHIRESLQDQPDA